jgi:hypothetical protein
MISPDASTSAVTGAFFRPNFQVGGSNLNGWFSPSGLPDFSWCNIPKLEKYTKWP